jgi:hypothetical protein
MVFDPYCRHSGKSWVFENHICLHFEFANIDLVFYILNLSEIQGIHCKASNDGCRAELNRTPLKNKILFSIFNFMNHIISSKNTLVYDIQTSLPYVRIGVTKESNNFSRCLHGLFS